VFPDAGSIPAASTKLKNDGPERGRRFFHPTERNTPVHGRGQSIIGADSALRRLRDLVVRAAELIGGRERLGCSAFARIIVQRSLRLARPGGNATGLRKSSDTLDSGRSESAA